MREYIHPRYLNIVAQIGQNLYYEADNLTFFQELTVDNLNIIEWPEKNPQFWGKKKYIRVELFKQKTEARLVILSFSF